MLEVQALEVTIHSEHSTNHVLNGVSYRVQRGQTVGLVGESGCGKTLSALAVLGLLPHGSSINGGQIILQNQVISHYTEEQYRQKVRGRKVGIIFQDAMVALNPVFTVGNQIDESVRINHPDWNRKQVRETTVNLLRQVQIPSPERRVHEYTHQLSGGMRQRVMIAMALAAEPDLLIADEPTTALDVTIQAQILDLLKELQQRTSMGILLITHDMGVVAEVCDQVNVMYGGRVVERGQAQTLFHQPRHPYTVGLLHSIPMGKTKRERLDSIPGTVKTFTQKPQGCVYQGRCPWVDEVCRQEAPAMRSFVPGLESACHRIEFIQNQVESNASTPA